MKWFKIKRIQQMIYAFLLLLVILIGLKVLVFDNRIVGKLERNMLHYQGQLYEEYNGSVTFTEFGLTLGKIQVNGVKCDLLPIKGQPEYLHISFGWDGRFYKKMR